MICSFLVKAIERTSYCKVENPFKKNKNKKNKIFPFVSWMAHNLCAKRCYQFLFIYEGVIDQPCSPG